jgi:RHH-type transcriptional regulator, rel operon repressor / antitoxin RelB
MSPRAGGWRGNPSVLQCVHMLHTQHEEPMSDKTHVSARIGKETLEELNRLAKVTKRSKNFLVAEAIKGLLSENAWQIEETRKAVAKADAGGPFVKHEDMTAWLHSWGSDKEQPPPEAAVKR